MKMREQIQHLEEQVASIREAFAELWGSISLYLSQEQIESLKTYHVEEFAELEGDEK
jgi:1-aminocyclopropane-1-carboxylate deaminase/D-cysteine desulfhydrase-like pyridoxal-dependent ACC family enzyme